MTTETYKECPKCKRHVRIGLAAHGDKSVAKEPTWTTEYPTMPGAYWIRNYQFKRQAEMTPCPRLVEVNAPYEDFYYFGIETSEDREMLVSAEWYGPIEPPEGI